MMAFSWTTLTKVSHYDKDEIITPRCLLGMGDSSDSVTIVIVSVNIMTVIAKNYYCDIGHVCGYKHVYLTLSRLNIPTAT